MVCNKLHFLLHFLRACNILWEMKRLLWSEVVFPLHNLALSAVASVLEEEMVGTEPAVLAGTLSQCNHSREVALEGEEGVCQPWEVEVGCKPLLLSISFDTLASLQWAEEWK